VPERALKMAITAPQTAMANAICQRDARVAERHFSAS
jgi:hypothetical protein